MSKARSVRYAVVLFVVAQLAVAAHATGGLRTAALSGTQVPDLVVGVQISDVAPLSVALNNQGETAFQGFLVGPGIESRNSSALFSVGRGTGLSTLAQVGGEVTGVSSESGPPVVFDIVNSPRLNDGGDFAFSALIDGPGFLSVNDQTLLQTDARGFRIFALEGRTPLGVASATEPVFDSFGAVSQNQSGDLAFSADLRGPGVEPSTAEAIFVTDGSPEATVIARAGQAAPGLAEGTRFAGFDAPQLNDSGEIAFRATLAGPQITLADDRVIARGTSILEIVAREGDPAAGQAAGVEYGGLGTPAFNGQGRVAFLAGLIGPGISPANDGVIYSDLGGAGLEVVVGEGDPAPDTNSTFSSFSQPALNDRGQVAFFAFIAGAPSRSNTGLFATDSAGVLQLVAREGSTLDVSDDPLAPDLRVIGRISFSPTEGLNELGQVAFSASFTDGSVGVFVSDLVAVPEPRSALLVAIAGAVASCGRACPTARRTCFCSRAN